MSNEKQNIIKYNARVVQKHDIEKNWEAATGFIPLPGEILVYDDLNRFKIGNGINTPKDLPFATIDLDTEFHKLQSNAKYYASFEDIPAAGESAQGTIGLMTPQDKYDLAWSKLITQHAVNSSGSDKTMGFYKFSTTTYGFIKDIEPVTAEDIEGMNIDTSTSGASNVSKKIFLVGAEEQANTSKTFTNSKAYIDKDGYLYSGSKKVYTEDSFVKNNQLTGLMDASAGYDKLLTRVLPDYVTSHIDSAGQTIDTAGLYLITTTNGHVTTTQEVNATHLLSILDNGEAVGTGLTLNLVDGTLNLDTAYYCTADRAGLMQPSEQSSIQTMLAKLANIDEGANKYVLPTASTSQLGGIKVGNYLRIDNGVLHGNYPIANYTIDGLLSAEYYSHLINHTHKFTYTPEFASIDFTGEEGTTFVVKNDSDTVATRLIDENWGASTVATAAMANAEERCVTITFAPLVDKTKTVALNSHTHTFRPAGTITFQGKEVTITTSSSQ